MVHYLYLQTEFGEDRCTQFRVIVVTDLQTHENKQTHRQDRLQYTAPLSLARSVITAKVMKSGVHIMHVLSAFLLKSKRQNLHRFGI